MEPVTGSALVAGGVSLANGISQIASNSMSQKKWRERQQYLEEQQKRAEKRQYDYNIDLQNYAYNKNLEQWHLENAYNSPIAQVARFKSAGLNPNLIYGDGGAMAAANSPAMQIEGSNAAAPAAAPYSEIPAIGGNFAEVAGLGIQQMLASAQARKLDADTLNSLKDLDFKDASFDLRLDEIAEGIANTVADTDLKGSQSENVAVDTEGKKIANEIADATKQTQIDDAAQTLENKRREGWNLEKMGQQIDAAINKMNMETALLGVQKRIAELDEKIKKVEADNADQLMELRKQREAIAIEIANKQSRIMQKELQYYDRRALAQLALSAAEQFNRTAFGKLASSETVTQDFKNKMNEILLDPTKATDARTYFSALLLKNMSETNALDVLEFVRDSFDNDDKPTEKPTATDKKSMTNEEILKISLDAEQSRQMYSWMSQHPNATEAERVEFKKKLLGID